MYFARLWSLKAHRIQLDGVVERERELPFIVLPSSLQSQFCKAIGAPYFTEARQRKGSGRAAASHPYQIMDWKRI